MKIQDIFSKAQNLAQQVNQQFRELVYDFWNFSAGLRGPPALALHCGTKNNEAMAPISCLTYRQKSGSNHPGGSPITRVDFGCGERDGPNHPSRTPVHSVIFKGNKLFLILSSLLIGLTWNSLLLKYSCARQITFHSCPQKLSVRAGRHHTPQRGQVKPMTIVLDSLG
jgi:hypothetical protein